MANGTRKFDDGQIREIQAALAAGESGASLARKYQCSAETISRLRNGLTYREKAKPAMWEPKEPTKEELDEFAKQIERAAKAAKEGPTEEAEILRKLGVVRN